MNCPAVRTPLAVTSCAGWPRCRRTPRAVSCRAAQRDADVREAGQQARPDCTISIERSPNRADSASASSTPPAAAEDAELASLFAEVAKERTKPSSGLTGVACSAAPGMALRSGVTPTLTEAVSKRTGGRPRTWKAPAIGSSPSISATSSLCPPSTHSRSRLTEISSRS